MSFEEKHTPLLLPAPGEGTSGDSDITTLEVGGKSISFDKLGPMIVNSDGTLSRISNWQELTPAEQTNTVRVLSKRNQLRMASVSKKQEHGQAEPVESKEPTE
ncbi:Fungal specific transcription factor domain [Ceratobasidium sp. AG-Ba]|nr:Fungal specific transcription factor domain [Ceratobasidium sp. AG-Ba]